MASWRSRVSSRKKVRKLVSTSSCVQPRPRTTVNATPNARLRRGQAVTSAPSRSARTCRAEAALGGVMSADAAGISSMVTSSQRGVAPVVAISLLLTCTKYQPISSVANVIGSDLNTSKVSPNSITAQSRPTPGFTRTRGSEMGACASNCANKSGGSLPRGRVWLIFPIA